MSEASHSRLSQENALDPNRPGTTTEHIARRARSPYWPVLFAAIFLAAVVAYPCRWRAKILGVGLGLPAVMLLNQLRLVSLCFLFRWDPAHLETAHVLVWQSLIVFLTLDLLAIWVATVARHDETGSA